MWGPGPRFRRGCGRSGGLAAARWTNRKGEVTMKNLLLRFVREEEGQDLIEYALLIVFIALVVVAALGPLGTQVSSVYTTISSSLAS